MFFGWLLSLSILPLLPGNRFWKIKALPVIEWLEWIHVVLLSLLTIVLKVNGSFLINTLHHLSINAQSKWRGGSSRNARLAGMPDVCHTCSCCFLSPSFWTNTLIGKTSYVIFVVYQLAWHVLICWHACDNFVLKTTKTLRQKKTLIITSVDSTSWLDYQDYGYKGHKNNT